MGLLEGKVAFVTGAARGQGRSHAVRVAHEGADVIAIDVCAQAAEVPYPLATPEDLEETVRQVEALDRRIVARKVDVRDRSGVKAALDEGVAELGRLDIVAANAGICTFATAEECSDQLWDEMIDINLTGVSNTARAAIPHLKANGGGGAIVITSSGAGIKGYQTLPHYSAAKHGLVGLMRVLALELAPNMIRVNTIHPTTVNTPMVRYMDTAIEEHLIDINALPVKWLESEDVSDALVWLCSDAARYVTGVALPVDAGCVIK
jgi:SDR family mycofactocin-dependent oxidoreductase